MLESVLYIIAQCSQTHHQLQKLNTENSHSVHIQSYGISYHNYDGLLINW